jgi:hypothetical protein
MQRTKLPDQLQNLLDQLVTAEIAKLPELYSVT